MANRGPRAHPAISATRRCGRSPTRTLQYHPRQFREQLSSGRRGHRSTASEVHRVPPPGGRGLTATLVAAAATKPRMAHDTRLTLVTLGGIAVIVLLIVVVKMHPFLA